MNRYGEPDSPILSEKPSNKTVDNKPMEEKVEKSWLRGIRPSKTGTRHRAGYSCEMSWIGYDMQQSEIGRNISYPYGTVSMMSID